MAQDQNSDYHNQIFEKLVLNTKPESHKRLIGMVAYAKYKIHEQKWKSNNPYASEKTIRSFLSHFNDDDILEDYRNDAEKKLFIFAARYQQNVEEYRIRQLIDRHLQKSTSDLDITGIFDLLLEMCHDENISKELKIIKSSLLERLKQTKLSEELKKVNNDLTQEISKTKVNYWIPVGQSIVASCCFTVVLFILALTIRFAAPDSNAGRLLQYLFAPNEYIIEIKEK